MSNVSELKNNRFTPYIILAVLTTVLLLFPATPGYCIDFITVKVFGAEIIKGRLVALSVLLAYYFITAHSRSVKDRVIIAANLFVFPLVLFIMLLPGNGLNLIPYCICMEYEHLPEMEVVAVFDLFITAIVGYRTEIGLLAGFGSNGESNTPNNL